MSAIRFHLDQQVSPRIAEGLRQHGIDVTTTVEVGLRTTSDETQLAFAVREGRVLVTHDDDFTPFEGRDHPGIAYCHQESLSIGEIIRYLALMAQTMQPDELHGHVEYIKRL